MFFRPARFSQSGPGQRFVNNAHLGIGVVGRGQLSGWWALGPTSGFNQRSSIWSVFIYWSYEWDFIRKRILLLKQRQWKVESRLSGETMFRLKWNLNINNSEVIQQVTFYKKNFPVIHVHYRKRTQRTKEQRLKKPALSPFSWDHSCKHLGTIL